MSWKPADWGAGYGAALATEWGTRADGTPVVAYGMNDGTARLVDPTTSGQATTLASSPVVAGVSAINAIPRFDGSDGGTDFAVAYETTPPPNLGGVGGLLRWDGGSTLPQAALAQPQAMVASSTRTIRSVRSCFASHL